MRKVKLLSVAAAALLITTAGSAAAQPAAANDPGYGLGLLNFCKAAETSADGIFCRGFVFGVVMTLDADPRSCVPDIRASQMVMVVRKYLEDNPARLHLHSDRLIRDAMQQNYPCPKR